MKHLVLLGGGHAHLAVLRRLACRPQTACRLTLVSPDPQPVYSGMVPGWVAGHYTLGQCRLPLGALAAAAHAEYRQTRATTLVAEGRRLQLADGSELAYDHLSIDIGSAPSVAGIEGASAFGVPLRPLEQFVARWRALLEGGADVRDLVIIGGGGGGVELACAMRTALDAAGCSGCNIRLLSGNGEPFADGPRALRKWVGCALREHRIFTSPDRAVLIGCDHVLCASGISYPSDFTVLATGSAAPDLFRDSGLCLDAEGYARIRQTLQVQDHPEVFAAGDCASLVDRSLPRSGVYAVRQGPVLAHNLAAVLAGRPLRHYIPQRRALYLLRTSERNAIASWGRFSWSGWWVWRWKDRIDRRFIRRMCASSAGYLSMQDSSSGVSVP